MRPPLSTDERLVLADQLQQENDPRGAFITAQCWLASRSMDPLHWAEVYRVAATLLHLHGAEWASLVLQHTGERHWTNDTAEFRRGFIEAIRIQRPTPTTGEWLAENTAVDDLRGYREIVPLAKTSFWGKLRTLRSADADVFRCLGANNSSQFHRFDLNFLDSVSGLAHLTELALPDLKALGVRGIGLSKRTLRRLCGSPWFSQLQRLDVGATRLTASDLNTLLQTAEDLRALEVQSLSGLVDHWEDVADLGAMELLNLRAAWGEQDLPTLKKLDLHRLQTLDLSSPRRPPSTDGYRVLADHWALPLIRKLAITNTRMGDTVLELLASAGWFRTVRELDLRSNSLQTAGIEALVQADPPCVSLDLSSNRLDDGAMAVLAAWPGLSRVVTLSLDQNRKITAEGLLRLLSSPHYEVLHLGVEGLGTDERCQALLRARYRN